MIQSPTKKKRNTSELHREVTCFFCIILVMAYEMFSSRNLWFKMFKIYLVKEHVRIYRFGIRTSVKTKI